MAAELLEPLVGRAPAVPGCSSPTIFITEEHPREARRVGPAGGSHTTWRPPVTKRRGRHRLEHARRRRREDRSVELCEDAGLDTSDHAVPDDRAAIAKALRRLADVDHVRFVFRGARA